MKNTIFMQSIAGLIVVCALAFTVLAQTQSPTVGRYTGINAETFENALFDITILANGKYEQNKEVGKFSYDAKTKKIEFLSGAMPKDRVGFFYKKGDDLGGSADKAAHDTLVIRDKKDVADGNLRDLFWYNCCTK